jgi:predicted RNA-binding Zn-ribbon protein involved in translation (DUF1610 family)
VARARSLSEFQTSFPDETSCAAFLFQRRWPQGFVCPACGGGRAALLKSRAHTNECLHCGRQTSITAGTAMHRSKLPLTVWFWAAHLMATHSNGMSAVQLEAQLGITYKTARLLAQKLRQSTIDPQREPLEGVVEVDQAEIPFWADNSFFDPVKSGKILIVGAVEVIDRGTNQAKPRRRGAKYLDTRSGRIRLAAIRDNSAASIEAFVRANVKTGTTLLIDGHRSYPGLTDYRHDPRTVGKMAGHSAALDSSSLRADEALGARDLSWAAPQAHRHVSQRVCLPIQSALLPTRLVRNHSRARLAPSSDELLGYRRARQSSQRRVDSPASAAAPQDSDRHAGGPIKTSRNGRTQPRCGFDPRY